MPINSELLTIPIIGVLIIISVMVIIRIIANRNIRRSLDQLIYFSPVEATGAFEETVPMFGLTKGSEYGILLLHGFSSSVNEFNELIKKIQQLPVNYYAPAITGFGINDVNLLRNIDYKDWLRDADNAYNLLSSVSNKVILVGHSAGGALSCYLAGKYKIPHIFITAPYIFRRKDHDIFYKILCNRLLFSIFKLFHPVVSKSKTKNNNLKKRFVYDAVPISAVKAVWDLSASLSLEKLNETFIYLYTGRNDNTVLEVDLLSLLDKNNLSYAHVSYKNSGHNILEDTEAVKVNEDIFSELKAVFLGK